MSAELEFDRCFGPEERFRIYQRDRRDPYGFALIATCPSAAAVGVALCQLAEDRWEAGDFSTPVMGVMDGETRRWVSGLWTGARSEQATALA